MIESVGLFLEKALKLLDTDRLEIEKYVSDNRFKNKLLYSEEKVLSDLAVKDYLNNYSKKELKQILTEFKTLDFNQKNIFLNALWYNSRYYADPKKFEFSFHKLDREIWRIKKGMVNINFIFKTGYGTCEDTIKGFIRALRAGTVFTTKMKIDGEIRRVIVKSNLGVSKKDEFNKGVYNLILDPKTFDIYDFYNPSKIKEITLKEISRFVLISKVNKNIDGLLYPNYRHYKPILKKEIKNYFKKHKENTSFKKRHASKKLKKPSLFSKIKKRIFRK
jgi:hypothetical protein